MDHELSNIRATSGAVAAGLMAEKGGELFITDAGLFAMAGAIAYDPEADFREHCMSGVLRALHAARAGGLDAQTEAVILWAFAEGVDAGDESAEGVALAALCRLAARLVGNGRMVDLIECKKPH